MNEKMCCCNADRRSLTRPTTSNDLPDGQLGKNLASWSLGITSGVWSVYAGDPIGLALTAAGVISGLVPSDPKRVSAYSYLFAVDRTFGM